MQCPKCGAENPAGKIVCRSCGTRLRLAATSGQPASTTRESDEQLRRWLTSDLLRIVWVTAVVIVVGLALGLFLK